MDGSVISIILPTYLSINLSIYLTNSPLMHGACNIYSLSSLSNLVSFPSLFSSNLLFFSFLSLSCTIFYLPFTSFTCPVSFSHWNSRPCSIVIISFTTGLRIENPRILESSHTVSHPTPLHPSSALLSQS